MVASRLSYVAESQSLFPISQSGFRQFRSVLDPLLRLSHDVQEAFSQRSSLLAVFFDIRKAYDTVSRSSILWTLYSSGFRGSMPTFLSGFLRDRSFQVRVGSSTSVPYPQEEGVPQGSVLSVLLFSFVMNTVTTSLPPTIQSLLYADDLVIYFTGKSLSLVTRQFQLAVTAAVEWASLKGLSFSPSKSCSILFRRRRNRQIIERPLLLSGSRIPSKQAVRFLGLIFDEKLSWRPHIAHLVTTTRPTLNLLRLLAHTTWGADRRTLLHLYHALLLPKLDFGCEVYASASPHTLRRLDPIQNMALRLASGALRSSPT